MAKPTFMASALAFALFILSSSCNAQLSSMFYDQTCPNALTTIRTSIREAISRERRMAASLIRLHFHDCFVGCDASILLDDTPSMVGEQNANPNRDSARGYEVIAAAKAKVEAICPGVVSCADILAVAARDSSFAVGGPSWTVKLGRRDSTSASRTLAESNLPGFREGLDRLISMFADKGLSARDMVALSGAHTIGQAQCFTFRQRIYRNESSVDAGFATTRRRSCPSTGGSTNLSALDLVTPNSFDNNYYKNLLQKRGLLETDQALFNGGSTDTIVSEYSNNPATFKSDFASAMPLTGLAGEIRKICSNYLIINPSPKLIFYSICSFVQI